MRRFGELAAMLAIGDGILGFLAPRRHVLLWKFGPEGYKKVVRGFAERPDLVRALAVIEAAGGLWLALRQYREG